MQNSWIFWLIFERTKLVQPVWHQQNVTTKKTWPICENYCLGKLKQTQSSECTLGKIREFFDLFTIQLSGSNKSDIKKDVTTKKTWPICDNYCSGKRKQTQLSECTIGRIREFFDLFLMQLSWFNKSDIKKMSQLRKCDQFVTITAQANLSKLNYLSAH